MTCESHIHTMQ